MRKEVEFENGVSIYYEESFWTGRKEIIFNGKELTKVKRNVYTDGVYDYKVKGSYFGGVTITVNEVPYEIYKKLNFFHILLILAPMLLVFIGGAIGAVIGILAASIIVSIIRGTENYFVSFVSSVTITGLAYGAYLVISIYLLSLIQ